MAINIKETKGVPKKEKIKSILCPNCKTETKHKCEWKQQKREEWAGGQIFLDNDDLVYSCMGCGYITLIKSKWFSENLIMGDDGNAEADEEVHYFPKRDHKTIYPRVEYHHLPSKVKTVYEEVINAYNEDLLILCAIGIRALIESVCIEEKISGKDLKEKIDGLATKNIITKPLSEGLQENRLIGNEGAHRIESYTKEELKIAINLIEILLENHYTIAEKIAKLKERKLKNK